MPVSDEEIAELLVKALSDTVTQPVYDAERKWNSKWGIFHALWQNNSVRDTDPLLINFFDSCLTADIGLLAIASHIVGSPLMYDHNMEEWVPYPTQVLNAVMDTLQNISTTVVPEATMRDVLIMALEHRLDTVLVADSMEVRMADLLLSVFPDSTFTLPNMGRKLLSGTHRTALAAIAEECPYEYGPGVYMARAMLSLHDTVPYLVGHECEMPTAPSSEKRGEEEEDGNEGISSEKDLIQVYPNPAHSVLFVDVSFENGLTSSLELYGIAGNHVGTSALLPGKNQIDISQYSSGLYFFKVVVNGRAEHSGKQVIMR